MALEAFNIKQLNRGWLRFQPWFHPFLQIAFVDPPKASLSEEEMRGEVLRGAAQLAQREIEQIAGECLRQILVEPAGGGSEAAVGEGELPERRHLRRRRQILRFRRRSGAADVSEDRMLVRGAAVPRGEGLPLLLLLRFRIKLRHRLTIPERGVGEGECASFRVIIYSVIDEMG